MSIDRIEITYTPHHKTLTEAGNSHFHRVVDALAEFVDNSIQASDNEKERRVHVSFFLNNLDGFLTISDNGVGMTSDTIKQFATYALDRETRSMQSTGRAGIGRFGVGAKQAGFYLGNRIRVITKCKDNEKVMEFSLDSEVLQQRFVDNQELYRDLIMVRNKDDHSLVPADERAITAMQTALTVHEKDHDNFTIFVIKMRRIRVQQMLWHDRYRDIANELAEIYHYHLHPEHLPDNISSIPKFKDAGGRYLLEMS